MKIGKQKQTEDLTFSENSSENGSITSVEEESLEDLQLKECQERIQVLEKNHNSYKLKQNLFCCFLVIVVLVVLYIGSNMMEIMIK
uniref:Coiled-coil domain-containing protein 167 n=1 Tax=Meloidogyne hapla TaxID=6305 RepID=A0A1I8B6H3_MELHA